MSDRRAIGILMLAALMVCGCAAVAIPSAAPQTTEGNNPPPVETAPPPILYPPRDPAATYPVIRTWEQVLTFEAYGYLKAIPSSVSTPIDGVYGKVDPGEPQWWRCARCPDFKLSGGNWRLMFHQGTLRMYYEVTGFSTVSSYDVTGADLMLYNDPHCPYETGEYTWKLQADELTLVEIRDPCAIHLRAENLTHQVWQSCQPPNVEAGVTDHWIRPPACG